VIVYQSNKNQFLHHALREDIEDIEDIVAAHFRSAPPTGRPLREMLDRVRGEVPQASPSTRAPTAASSA